MNIQKYGNCANSIGMGTQEQYEFSETLFRNTTHYLVLKDTLAGPSRSFAILIVSLQQTPVSSSFTVISNGICKWDAPHLKWVINRT